ncbi:MAG: GNAT family N-acetyltransferase [Acidimicrobiia bacterium]|nr:GNAT family N-acetyltransferase [Acidimicrobiia bacterium]
MKPRPFRGDDDVYLLQEFTAETIRAQGRLGLLHPGDVVHLVYNVLRLDDPTELIHIWQDGGGVVLGWAWLHPRWACFELQISNNATRRFPDLEREINVWSEERLLTLMRGMGSEAEYIETDASVDDAEGAGLLADLGWIPADDAGEWLSRRPLAHIASPELSAGYVVRSVRGIEEAGQVAEVHAASFGSSWTPELYERVMNAPGYSPDREIVVEAPDGLLAGFCVVWPDPVNLVGLFEPVGVHPEHRRLGLGRAVLRAGMLAMRKLGMRHAEVGYEVDNPAAGPLYRSEGFEPIEQFVRYRKSVGVGSP